LTEKGQILKSAWVITLAIIADQNLRVFPRIARHFDAGTSVVADSFILAFRMPNLLRRLIGEGSLRTCSILVFAGYLREKSRAELWQFANRLFWTLTVVAHILVALGLVLWPQVTSCSFTSGIVC
jgi:putative peptidoglycan lipid II flippase